MMKILIYAKKRTTSEGKTFFSYLTKLLSNKTGETITASVKFAECDAPKADTCPCYIEFDKADANLATKESIDEETGNAFTSKTLWIKKYKVSDEKYVDTSLDEF